ncbi:Cupin-like domain protein [Colletotrichum asianum]
MIPDEKAKSLDSLMKAGIFISLISIAAAFTFVTWLWWTPQDNNHWRSWVLANRLQPSVTLASVVIRTAVGTLAATATAMIAAVAVERRGVHLIAIARVSTARFSGSGPLSLGSLVLRPSRLDIGVRLIVMLLILITFAVQFISTLLVSDLQQGEVLSLPRSIPNIYSVGLQNDTGTLTSNPDSYWSRRPRFAETFAEYSEAGVDDEGIEDTGPTIRAFLPFESTETRESVSTFRGMARVSDSRVVCLRPMISNLTLCEIELSDSESNVGICGVLQLNRSAAVAAGLHWSGNDRFSFGCPLPDLKGLIWQICQNHTFDGVLTSSEWSLYNHDRTDDIKLLWQITGHNIPMFSDYDLYNPSSLEMLGSTANGAWTSQYFNLTLHRQNMTEYMHAIRYLEFNMTICAQARIERDSIRQLEIHASRLHLLSSRTARAEPTYGWSKDSEGFATESLRKQLNAVTNPSSSLRPYDRDGTLDIDQKILGSSIAEAPHGEWTKYGTGRMMNDFLGSLFDRSQDAPILLCSNCLRTWSPSYVMVDDLYTQIFEDTLNATSSPARALQAMYFTLERSVYYDKLSRYSSNELNDSEPPGAEIMTVELTQIPEHHRGYWAVVGILTAFLATFAVVAWLYRPMLYSLPGNSWHAIAQISESAELADLLRKARLSTDDEVEQMIGGTPKKTSSRGDGFVIYAREGLRRVQQRFLAVFKSSASSRSQRTVPRLVLREGVFVRASEEEAYTKLRASGFRRRLPRKNSWSESVE